MIVINPLPVKAPPPPAEPAPPPEVMLANGKPLSLGGLSRVELHQLQWEQEQKFAAAIMAFPPQSPEREMVIGQAYDTVCTILAAQCGESKPLVMGCDPKYVRLVLQLLQRQINAGCGQPRLFEVGYGCGMLLKEVREHGYHVGGVEVSAAMRDQAAANLGERYAADLLVGDLRSVTAERLPGRPSLVYWNDVFEHVPTDEIEDYLRHIHSLLAPRGQLVTLTPNWLLRPSDVTCDFCPPRTPARGLHLREYRLAEVTRLLRQAGFRRAATPLFATHGRMQLVGAGGRRAKQLVEPLLDRLPVRWARLLCRGLAMSCTIAQKA